MMARGLGEAMRIPAVTIVLMLGAAAGLGGCVPDVVSLEAVPTPKFSRDLAQCNAVATDAAFWDNAVKRCMKAKGYQFLKQY
jgi:Pyruvate/2-oxoacid:ferredoxin oxidoreductase gamma subunit